jgi:tRNA (mo5U34)-methyltransferase
MSTAPFAYVRGWKNEFESKGWWHSFDLPDGRHIDGVCSVEGLRKRLDQYPIPEDLTGLRVLDIGAWDGWYSFEMERRGARVLAVDCWDNPRFHQIHAALNSRVEYRQMDVYDLTPETVGRFDIVLFMGVLYHLKHPLLALERVCAITTRLAIVDSFVLQEKHRPGEEIAGRPIMEFYETEELGGQTDNWCGPTVSCLLAFCRTAGFARVEHRATLPDGACVACHRKWEPPPEPADPAPELLDVAHHTNFGINFQTRHDEYLTAVIRTPVVISSLDQIQPEVAGYGVRPIHFSLSAEGLWQIQFKLPPGLTPGWHEVRISLHGSAPSQPVEIAVDLPLADAPVQIVAVCDGTTWEPGLLTRGGENLLSAWVTGMPRNADRANLHALLGGEKIPVLYVSTAYGNEARQINLRVPNEAPAGVFELQINQSPAIPVRIS